MVKFSKVFFPSQTLKTFFQYVLVNQTDFQMWPSLLTYFSKQTLKHFSKKKKNHQYYFILFFSGQRLFMYIFFFTLRDTDHMYNNKINKNIFLKKLGSVVAAEHI